MAVPEEVGVSAERLERIRPVMQGYVDAGNLPGFQQLWRDRGKIVHFETIGMRMLRIKNPLNPIQYSVSIPCQNRLPVSL